MSVQSDNNPPKTTGRLIDWAALVKKIAGPPKPQEEPAYEFSSGRKFRSTDHTDSGIYEDT